MAPGADAWSGFSGDPRLTASSGLRASDADRDHAVDMLRDAFADGRLSREEYGTRSDAALATRELGGFVPILTDLVPRDVGAPVPSASRGIREQAIERYRRDLRDARNGWIFVSTLCTAIWGATSAASGDMIFFWPVFPAIGVGIGYLSVRLNAERRIEDHEDSIDKNLQKRRRRELDAD